MNEPFGLKIVTIADDTLLALLMQSARGAGGAGDGASAGLAWGLGRKVALHVHPTHTHTPA